MCLKFEIYFPPKNVVLRISFKEILLWSDRVALVYSLLNLIHFHMNTLTFPWEIEDIY